MPYNGGLLTTTVDFFPHLLVACPLIYVQAENSLFLPQEKDIDVGSLIDMCDLEVSFISLWPLVVG